VDVDTVVAKSKSPVENGGLHPQKYAMSYNSMFHIVTNSYQLVQDFVTWRLAKIERPQCNLTCDDGSQRESSQNGSTFQVDEIL